MAQAMFDLTGRLALVTGASRGLGLAMARGLAEAGARVVLNGRDVGRLTAAVAELATAGIAVEALAFDVCDPTAVEDAVADIEARLGPIHILVNNAGISRPGPAAAQLDAAWREVIATNLDAVFFMARAVGRRMVERRVGKIINIGSMLGLTARPGTAPYTTSKAAVHGLTRALCADWAGCGVQVNCIAPGAFETEMTRPLYESPEVSAYVRSRTPAGRWGRPADLVGTAVFLAAPASDFVNGQVIVVDGGILSVI
ncbi:SDR family oxidoreductase [Belnapia sp. T6]|uniref:SDR family oxidoreductase n=1 Tax=Belnapia mucosa TaxID=2804532 RepID=A0ABS1VF80_9PROT|nr:SDR family NAD(P)-dependent oxidoreductase [Belnapia mucosa]MBL6459053.1 SDR family oxidoreductase [Belnapia mucosa]